MEFFNCLRRPLALQQRETLWNWLFNFNPTKYISVVIIAIIKPLYTCGRPQSGVTCKRNLMIFMVGIFIIYSVLFNNNHLFLCFFLARSYIYNRLRIPSAGGIPMLIAYWFRTCRSCYAEKGQNGKHDRRHFRWKVNVRSHHYRANITVIKPQGAVLLEPQIPKWQNVTLAKI